MISTGTFLELTIKVDTDPIPVILGRTRRGYFICLPDHDASFELKHFEDVDEDSFTCYMDGTSALMVAGIVKQALGLLFYCGGVLDYL
jgi:hypothetical protein